MAVRQRFITALCFICFLAALPAAAWAAPDAEQQQRLAEQKLKLVEMLVNSPAAQANSTSEDTETAALVNRGRELLKQAQDFLAAQQYAEAMQALDEALRSVSKANSRNAGGLSVSAQKQRLQEMGEQVAAYRASLAELTKDKTVGAEAQALLQRVDGMVVDANKLAAAERYGPANKMMAEAYKLEVAEISRLRAGQEVVLSLKFDTPADEYAYEQKRFQSNTILVNMMIDEGRAPGAQRYTVDNFLAEAGKLKADAEALAGAGSYPEAIKVMEKASTRLNRALQAMGLPVY
jgi:hypothetical protein